MGIDNKATAQYAQRNRLLRQMGLAQSYAEYLKSDLWKSIRVRVLQQYRGKCVGCGRKATQVHHNAYTKKNLSGESIEKMVAICHRCHEQAEFEGDVKVSPQVAQQRLDALRCKSDKKYAFRKKREEQRKEARKKRREREAERKRYQITKRQQDVTAPKVSERLQKKAERDAERARIALEQYRAAKSKDGRQFFTYDGLEWSEMTKQQRRIRKMQQATNPSEEAPF